MAISSFEHNVIIRDKDKIDEVKNALSHEPSTIANVKPSKKDSLPPNAKEIWFPSNKI